MGATHAEKSTVRAGQLNAVPEEGCLWRKLALRPHCVHQTSRNQVVQDRRAGLRVLPMSSSGHEKMGRENAFFDDIGAEAIPGLDLQTMSGLMPLESVPTAVPPERLFRRHSHRRVSVEDKASSTPRRT